MILSSIFLNANTGRALFSIYSTIALISVLLGLKSMLQGKLRLILKFWKCKNLKSQFRISKKSQQKSRSLSWEILRLQRVFPVMDQNLNFSKFKFSKLIKK